MSDAAALSSATIVSLRDGRASVAVAPEIGGAIAAYRWRVGDSVVDWMRPASENALRTRDVERLSCFPLFPYSNRVRGGRFRFGGRDIALPAPSGADPHAEHGHGWRRAWEWEQLAPNRMAFRYRHAPDAWPWAYEAGQLIELTERTLKVTLSIGNLGTAAMPCGMGLHPYFPRCDGSRLTAPVERMWRTDADVLPVELEFCSPERDPARGIRIGDESLDNCFVGWSGRARIDWPGESRSLAIDADPPLRALVLYTPPQEDFFCVEPVSNVTDAFNLASAGRDDTGILVLAPGARISASVRFTPRHPAFN